MLCINFPEVNYQRMHLKANQWQQFTHAKHDFPKADHLGMSLKVKIVVAVRHAHIPEGDYQCMSLKVTERAHGCCESVLPKVTTKACA